MKGENTMISKKCKYCDKEIEGYSEKHVDYMMKQHVLSKHEEEEEQEE